MDIEFHEAFAPAQRVLVLVTEARDERPALQAAQCLVQGDSQVRLTVLWAVEGGSAPPPLSDSLAELPEKFAAVVKRQVCAGNAGDVIDEAIALIEREQAELVVTCNRGVVTQRLVRRSSCSLLVLPEQPGHLSGPGNRPRVLVPVDFTPESESGARFAIKLAESRSGEHPETSLVDLVHVYEVPVGHHKMGWTTEQFKRRMARLAEKRLLSLMQRLAAGGGLVVRVSWHHGTRVAKVILDLAQARGCTDLVLGSRHRTPLVGLLFPSVVERVVLSAQVPVWVIRGGLPSLGLTEALWCR